MLTLREDTDGGAAKYQASSRSRSHPQIRSEREGVIIGLAMTYHYDSSLVVVYEVNGRAVAPVAHSCHTATSKSKDSDVYLSCRAGLQV